jgi:hypothetical protein
MSHAAGVFGLLVIGRAWAATIRSKEPFSQEGQIVGSGLEPLSKIS